MNARNCRKCGRLFNYVLGPIVCPACREALEQKFQQVKKFVQENKNATIPIVSEECDVEPGQIQQWIREERLQFADDSPIKLNCELCGTMIGTGRFCEKCKVNMARDLSGAFSKPQQTIEPKKKQGSTKDRMRYLDS